MDKTFFIHNREKLVKQLSDMSITFVFAGKAPQKSADEAYRYHPNRNFYYLTGIDQPNVVLVMKKTNNQIEEILFIEKADPVMEKWVGKTIAAEEAQAVSGVARVLELDNLDSFLTRSFLNEDIKAVYLDLERRAWDGSESLAQQFARRLRENYPYLQINNVYLAISELRVFKTKEEIEKIKQAIAITHEGLKNLMRNNREGMMEYQLEAYFDFTLKSAGVKHFAFNTIVASGRNATVLHYDANNAQVKNGDLVLLDFGAQVDYYNADISFTFPVNGTFTERQKQIYNIVLKTLRETTALIKPGLKFAELNEQAKKHLAEECKNIGLIQEESEINKYYYHGIGHFLGLDTHDVGTYKDRVLEPGMVITIEPGLYIEEEGIGVRIEDDILVTELGHENLSKDIIRTVEEIEAFMKH